jgi:inorganic pyrophosphatase
LWERVQTYRDCAEIDLQRIAHFFQHYKHLEPDKWVEIKGWGEPEKAHRLIQRRWRGSERAAMGP